MNFIVNHPTVTELNKVELNETERNVIKKAILLFDKIINQALSKDKAFDKIADSALDVSMYLSIFYSYYVKEKN